MSQLTTHILDTTKGKPAQGVTIKLYQQADADWHCIATGITNDDGRIANLLEDEKMLALGNYKMKFETKAYFDLQQIQTFYPFVEIIFTISNNEHYHIPLLLNPFAYSTYRGS
jgi:5-hydroxyisourate hydrolase